MCSVEHMGFSFKYNMGIYPSVGVRKIEKIDEGVWVKFLAPISLREKLIKYSSAQGKPYAQVLREYIEQLEITDEPDVNAKKE